MRDSSSRRSRMVIVRLLNLADARIRSLRQRLDEYAEAGDTSIAASVAVAPGRSQPPPCQER